MCQKMKSKMGPRPISRLCWPGPARRICRYTIPGRGGISTARSKKPMFVTATNFSNAFVCGKPCRGLDPYCIPHSKPCQATDIGAIPRVLRVCARESCGQWPYEDHLSHRGLWRRLTRKCQENPMKIPRFYLENSQKIIENSKNCDFYGFFTTQILFGKSE